MRGIYLLNINSNASLLGTVRNNRLPLLVFIIVLFASCRPKSTETTGDHVHGEINSLLVAANGMANNGDKHTIKYLDSGYAAFKTPGADDLWAKYNFEANYYLNKVKDLDQAMQAADSMFNIVANKGPEYKNEYAKALFIKGDVALAYRQYTLAYKFYYDGRTYTRKYLDSCNCSDINYRMGLLEYQRGNYLKVVPYIKLALLENNYCTPNKNFDELFIRPQQLLNTIGLCFEKVNMPDSAIYYYNKALVFIQDNQSKFPDRAQFAEMAKGVVYGNIGGVYIGLEKYAAAEKSLIASVDINEQPGFDKTDAQTARLKLAQLYLKLNKPRDAGVQLNAVGQWLNVNKNNATGTMLNWLTVKWHYLKQTGNATLALTYFQRYADIKDSVNKVNLGLKNNDLEVAFKSNEQRYQLALLSKDNDLKTSYLTAVAVFSVMSIIILWVVWFSLKKTRKNVAELKTLNLQMKNTVEVLQFTQSENSRVLKIVAHDLRNPITSIFSLASMMLESPQLSVDDRHILENIQTSGKNCIDLVSDLLRVNIKTSELKKEDTDLEEILKYCVAQLKNKAADKGQQLVLKSRPCIIPGSPENLWRVISNLIDNAIKFSPRGAVVTITLEQSGNAAVISVKDSGIGIPDEMKKKLFGMSAGSGRTGTAGEKSFGMGLSISKQIVEAHGGRLWFESEPGTGTTFYVELLTGNS